MLKKYETVMKPWLSRNYFDRVHELKLSWQKAQIVILIIRLRSGQGPAKDLAQVDRPRLSNILLSTLS